MNDEKQYYQNLCQIMLKTRGARFKAAARLTMQERLSVCALSILSVFLTAVSVALLSTPEYIDAYGAKIFGILSTIASVWILVITLYDYAQGRAVLAHRLHENALSITKLLRQMERELQKGSPDYDLIRAIANSYEEEISKTYVNHTACDYKMHILDTQAEKENWRKRLSNSYIRFKCLVFSMSFSVISSALVLIFIVTMMSLYFFCGALRH